MFCVQHFLRHQSVTVVRRAFRSRFGVKAPHYHSIMRWCKQFENTGSIHKGKPTGRPRTPNDSVDRVRQAFENTPIMSTNQASRQLAISQSTVWRILTKILQMRPYKFALHQKLKPEDKIARLNFCLSIQEKIAQNEEFASRLVFSDESCFHLSGKVNRHNIRIWGTQSSHEIVEYARDSPKVNVFCAISNQKVYGPYFFTENTVNGGNYLEMLDSWLIPQLQRDLINYVFQQDGAPPHWHRTVRNYLNQVLPLRWIGRSGQDDLTLTTWPPRSPDLTPCDFFLWGYIKDLVYVPPLPTDVEELKDRIRAAIQSITGVILGKVWEEFNKRLDMIKITRGGHFEHL